MKIFQIAAGTPERNYTDLFLNHDVMFMGPGRYSEFNKDLYKKLAIDGIETSQKVGQIYGFVENVKPGDIILLRNVHKVVAIGVADKAPYEWNPTFDDIFGWDLQHTRRVIWQEHLSETLDEIQSKKDLFGERKQMVTFSAVNDERVINRIKELFSECKTRSLRKLPAPPPKPLDMDQFGQELFSKGIPNEAVDKVIVAVERQRRLIRWYSQNGGDSYRPTEHEVVAHMILPLLLALGWSEQLLAVEWHKIDLAAFWGTPTTAERCTLVCEAKGYRHGLQNIFDQAKYYVEHLGLNDCRKILLTDGGRLYLYERIKSGWRSEPTGYLNVELIRTNHVVPKNTNAIDTIVALTPSGITREVTR